MRNLFWILLLANVILFAVMQRGGFDWGEPAVQPLPDLNGEMMRLLSALPGPPAKTTTAAPPSAIAKAALAPPAPPPASKLAAPREAKPDTPVCLEWGDFSGSDLTRATDALSGLQLSDKVGRRQIEQDIGYWVYMPPLKDKAAVNRKIGELKALGITDYFVVQAPGKWLNAISLGVFKTRDAAENFLHALNAKGVRTARVGERASKLTSTIFVLDKIDSGAHKKIEAMLKDFPGSELNVVPCGLTR